MVGLRNGVWTLWVTAAVMVFVTRINTAPTTGEADKSIIDLVQNGYVSSSIQNTNISHRMDEKMWETDDELDDSETVQMTSLPRCGVENKVGVRKNRTKRYVLQGSRWRVKNITYKISKYPTGMSRAETDAQVAKAFSVWSDYTDLVFTQVHSGKVRIKIRFEKGEHGDSDPFDGPGGILAHADFPVNDGEAHFDDSEMWSINSKKGPNFFQVAAHEFGHSLGLLHSKVRSALMSRFYRGYDPAFQLDQDDIKGIQALYGPKTQNTSNPTVPRVTTSNPLTEDSILCSDPNIDTIFNSPDGDTFVFKGEYYWRLTDNAVESGYPRLISSSWLELPGNIDAAFTYRNRRTYFFRGSQYWRYNGYKIDGDYPKKISEGFKGIPNDIDAALVWSGNGKIYFLKGSQFWRFDTGQRPPVKSTYPQNLSSWVGIPDNIDAALQYPNGYTYIFKGGSYWRFNDRTFTVENDYPAFPRSTRYWWFGCKSAPHGTITDKIYFTNDNADYEDDDI